MDLSAVGMNRAAAPGTNVCFGCAGLGGAAGTGGADLVADSLGRAGGGGGAAAWHTQ